MAEDVGGMNATVGVIVKGDVQDIIAKTKTLGDALGVASEQASGTRTVFLYMAFGLMAAGGMLGRIGQAFGNVAKHMSSAYAEVEYQAAIVGTVLGSTAKETEQVASKMMELSIITGFSSKQVGEAMQGLAMAGFNFNQVMGATKPILNMARVGMMDVGDAVNLAVGIYNGFEMQAKDTNTVMQTFAMISDELVYAANESVISIQGLAESFKFVAASAQLAGWSVEETMTVLMTAGDNMIRAGIAGRNLRISLQKLQQLAAATSGELLTAAEIVQQYGLEIVTVDGKLRGMADIVEELQTKLVGLTDVQRNTALSAIFGTEALTLWSAMFKKNVKDLREEELALTAVGAKAALFNQFGGDTVSILTGWREQVQGHTLDLNDLENQLLGFGITVDAVDNIIKVITSTSENWTSIINQASSAEKIATERLSTLKGSIDVMRASWETLYASYGKSMAPLLEDWNKLLTDIAKLLSKLPDGVKLLIGILTLAIYTITTIIGKLFTFVGTLLLVAAAQKVVNQQQIIINGEMAKTIGYQQLLSEGWLTVSGSMGVATKTAYALASGLAITAGYIFAMTFIIIEMVHAFRTADYVMGILYFSIMVVASALWLIWLRARILRAELYLSIGGTKLYTLAMVLLGRASLTTAGRIWLMNIAIGASAIALIVFAIVAVKSGVWWLQVLAIALGVAAVAMWYFNVACWANPLLAIAGVIAMTIGALGLLTQQFGESGDAYQDSGHSPFLLDIKEDAERATMAVNELGKGMSSFNGKMKTGVYNFRNISQPASGNRVFSPSVHVNISGTNVNGNMSEEKLGRVVSKATSETLRQLNSDFERSTA